MSLPPENTPKQTFSNRDVRYTSFLFTALNGEDEDTRQKARKGIEALNSLHYESVPFSIPVLVDLQEQIRTRIWEDRESYVEMLELLEITQTNPSLRIVYSMLFGEMITLDEGTKPPFVEDDSVLTYAGKLKLTHKRKEIVALLPEKYFFCRSNHTRNLMVRLMDSIASEETYQLLMQFPIEEGIGRHGFRLLYPYYAKTEVKQIVRAQVKTGKLIPEELTEWANLTLDPLAYRYLEEDHRTSFQTMGDHHLNRFAYFEVCGHEDVPNLLADTPTRAYYREWFAIVQRTGSWEVIRTIGQLLVAPRTIEDLLKISQNEIYRLAANALWYFQEKLDRAECTEILRICMKDAEDFEARKQARFALLRCSSIPAEQRQDLLQPIQENLLAFGPTGVQWLCQQEQIDCFLPTLSAYFQIVPYEDGALPSNPSFKNAHTLILSAFVKHGYKDALNDLQRAVEAKPIPDMGNSLDLKLSLLSEALLSL
jgi:hypothetical protein